MQIILGLIIVYGFVKLFIWFFFKNGLADLMTGPPPDDLTDEELIEMGMERWVHRRNRFK